MHRAEVSRQIGRRDDFTLDLKTMCKVSSLSEHLHTALKMMQGLEKLLLHTEHLKFGAAFGAELMFSV